MNKVDATVRRETIYIALWTVILSALMEAVFLILGLWDYTVLLGNLLGSVFAVLNFFLMGLSVQKALGQGEKRAADIMRISQTLRLLMLFAGAMLAVGVDQFHLVAALIPYLFPRIAIMFRPLFYGRIDDGEAKGGEQ